MITIQVWDEEEWNGDTPRIETKGETLKEALSELVLWWAE